MAIVPYRARKALIETEKSLRDMQGLHSDNRELCLQRLIQGDTLAHDMVTRDNTYVKLISDVKIGMRLTSNDMQNKIEGM